MKIGESITVHDPNGLALQGYARLTKDEIRAIMEEVGKEVEKEVERDDHELTSMDKPRKFIFGYFNGSRGWYP